MPKLVHKVPAYTLHKRSGNARVKINGRTIELGKYGSTASREKYAALIATTPTPDQTPPVYAPPAGSTWLVGQCAVKFYEHACKYYVNPAGKHTGEHDVIRWALKPLIARFDYLPVQEFGPRKLKEVREDMVKAGWTRYTVNKAIGVIRRCFTWCASEEYCRPEIAMGLRTVSALKEGRSEAREKEPIGPVDDARIEATLPLLTPTMADALRFMRSTGCRPGEVCTMRANEIDRSNPDCWWYRPTSHKCAHKQRGRVIPLGAKAQDVVRPRLVKAGAGGLVFPITPDALRRSVQRACVKGGIPIWAPNQIRHTVGTEARARHGIEAARCLLGHATADMTLTYAERDMAQAGEYAKKFG